MAGIFVSHATADALLASELAVEIKTWSGCSPWLAENEIKPSENYAEIIFAAMSEASAVAVVLTQSSLQSVHVKREVNLAIDLGKPMFVFRADWNIVVAGLPGEWRYWLGIVQIHDWAGAHDAASVICSALMPDKPRPQPKVLRQVSASEPCDLRSALLVAARAGLSLDDVRKKLLRRGIAEEEIFAAATKYRASGLIGFTGEPRRATRLALRA